MWRFDAGRRSPARAARKEPLGPLPGLGLLSPAAHGWPATSRLRMILITRPVEDRPETDICSSSKPARPDFALPCGTAGAPLAVGGRTARLGRLSPGRVPFPCTLATKTRSGRSGRISEVGRPERASGSLYRSGAVESGATGMRGGAEGRKDRPFAVPGVSSTSSHIRRTGQVSPVRHLGLTSVPAVADSQIGSVPLPSER